MSVLCGIQKNSPDGTLWPAWHFRTHTGWHQLDAETEMRSSRPRGSRPPQRAPPPQLFGLLDETRERQGQRHRDTGLREALKRLNRKLHLNHSQVGHAALQHNRTPFGTPASTADLEGKAGPRKAHGALPGSFSARFMKGSGGNQ